MKYRIVHVVGRWYNIQDISAGGHALAKGVIFATASRKVQEMNDVWLRELNFDPDEARAVWKEHYLNPEGQSVEILINVARRLKRLEMLEKYIENCKDLEPNAAEGAGESGELLGNS